MWLHFVRCWDSVSSVDAVFYLSKMWVMDKLLEQRNNIKFLAKMKKTVTNIYKMLQKDTGEGRMSRT
jgi:phosphoglycerate dehydrogenase-like enzyme